MRFIKPALRAVAIVSAALLSVAAHPNWTATVAVTPAGGHLLGNPAAKVKLVEYVSYTCSHCAHFQKQSEAMLRLAYVTPGKVSVEVRHLIRDPIDLTVAVLTNCGPPAGFFRSHSTFLATQDSWIHRIDTASDVQKQRWTNGTTAARLRAIATDFGFYAIMEQRGLGRAAVDRCLADEALSRRIAEQNGEAQRLGIEGTPSFLLNGLLLAGTHDWPSLEPQIKARL